MEQELRPLTPENLDEVFTLYQRNEQFFKITKADFEQQTLEDFAFNPELSLVHYIDNKPIAVIVGVVKKWFIKKNLFIKVFMVDQEYRRHGIGTWMFHELLTLSKPYINMFSSMVYGFSPPQFLQPGVDVRHTSLLFFLQSMGLKRRKPRHNLVVQIPKEFPEPTQELSGFKIQRITSDYFEKTLQFVQKAFIAPTWPAEVKLTFDSMKSLTFIALDPQNNVVGFASHSTCFKGSFGPTGVLKSLRGKKLGGELLKWCIWDLKNQGFSTMTIMYVVGDTVKFYAKAVGAYIHPVHIPMRSCIFTLRRLRMSSAKVSRRGKPDIPYCPTCLHMLDSAGNTQGWLNAKLYRCSNCGYEGSFYVTKDLESSVDSAQT